MTRSIMVILTIFLAACSKGGSSGGSSGGGHVPDTTPHTYAADFVVLTGDGLPHSGHLHQVCNFGFSGTRDESTDVNLTMAGTAGGIGCAAAHNWTLEATNTGIYELSLGFYVDGVYDPSLQQNVLPGATYTFQRGY